MKILVLGADGMLGHQVVQSLRPRFDIAGTVRQNAAAYLSLSSYLPDTIFDQIDVRNFESVERVVRAFKPEVIINAVGIVKQRDEAKNATESIEVNSLLPQRLADLASHRDCRLIHMSTDCVFSGITGNYRDDDTADADDLYGRSKRLGEVSGAGIITLRTSIIGLELTRRSSLIEWFLSQRGQISGYRRAIYSGFTTLEMCRIIEHLIVEFPGFSGIYNVSSEAINKYRLLCELRDRLGLKIEIRANDDFVCDRSLDSSDFRVAYDYRPPTWSDMLDELAGQIVERRRLECTP